MKKPCKHMSLFLIALAGLFLVAFALTQMLVDMPEKGTVMHSICEAMAYIGCILLAVPIAVYLALEMNEKEK